MDEMKRRQIKNKIVNEMNEKIFDKIEKWFSSVLQKPFETFEC